MSGKFDVLKPELLWIGNRCYRKNPIRDDSKNPEEEEAEEIGSSAFEQYEEYGISVEHDGTKFFKSLNVPGCLKWELRALVKKLERQLSKEDTKVKILCPLDKADSIEVGITSVKKRGVFEACRQIYVFIESSRFKMNFTHFVSIPMNFDNIQTSFMEFKKNVLETCKTAHGVTESIFQDPRKLHLTVVPLIFMDKQESETAIAAFQKCKDSIYEILGGKPLTVLVKGIEYMNDDPAEVDVLYAKVQLDEYECLQRISELLLQKFKEEKFVTKDEDSVKLHITLMNSTFRQDEKEQGENEQRFGKKRLTFDASPILKSFGDYEFGIVTISEIHLSVRYTKSETGYYMSASVLNLPNEKIKY